MATRDLRRGRRAKIVCTLGPAIDSDEKIQGLIRHGMDAARLNMSFGSVDEHAERIEQLHRHTNNEGTRPITVIADLPGRKIRLGYLEGKSIRLENEDKVRFVPDEGGTGDPRNLPVPLAFFNDNMVRGDRVLLSDGVVELEVEQVASRRVEARVVYGGKVSERTGVHAPAIPSNEPPITEADMPYLKMAADQNVDYVAVGWVADDRDLLSVRETLSEVGRGLPVIAKIERSEAFSRLDGILRRSDAVMIRRGDLGAQIEITRVPIVQKEVLRLANQAGVPAIIATQMLGSMIDSPRPTRAEASDVANAVVDGADGILLSSETAIGNHPVEAVDMVARIFLETERETIERPGRSRDLHNMAFADATAQIAVRAASSVGARLIVCFTESGRTARLVSKYRPEVPILAFCGSQATRRRLAMVWGLRSDLLEHSNDVEEMVRQVQARLLDRNLAALGDTLVLVFGAPMGTSGRTNTVRLHRLT